MKEQKRKDKKEIVVLDKGIDAGKPGGFCCWMVFAPLR